MAATSTDPKSIQYLLDPAAVYDCYVTVGNSRVGPVEEIGVVPKMLFAHSVVMRTDLQMKNIGDKVPYKINDILPHTFKHLLRFVYGHDTSSTLSFDEADNLLYAAEKYMISDLKNNLAQRLMSLLNYDNICSLMNNPACYQALELNACINRILRIETRKVFASPHFLELTSDAFVKILEHEALNVEEVEVWRNALLWAKKKANCEDGDKLRKELAEPIKYIRLCTLSSEDFRKEVRPTKVLSDQEAVKVGISVGNREKQLELTEICSEVVVRKQPKSEVISKVVELNSLTYCSTSSTFLLNTKELGVELKSLTLSLSTQRTYIHQLDFIVKIEEKDRPETKTLIDLDLDVNIDSVIIPVSTDEQEVLLLPNTRYKINITCNYHAPLYRSASPQNNDHFTLTYDHQEELHNSIVFSVVKIEYKTVIL